MNYNGHMIRIHNFRRVQTGCKVATFDVEMPKMGFTIFGMSLLTSKGKSWVSYPRGKDFERGDDIYRDHCKFTNAKMNDTFINSVTKEIMVLMQSSIDSLEDSVDVPF